MISGIKKKSESKIYLSIYNISKKYELQAITR